MQFSLDMTLMLAMALCTLSIQANALLRTVTIGVYLLASALYWSDSIEFENSPSAGNGLYLLLSISAFTSLMISIVRAPEVSKEVIVNAVSAYLLLGITWALIFSTIHLFEPPRVYRRAKLSKGDPYDEEETYPRLSCRTA